jgi:hypothetical protein
MESTKLSALSATDRLKSKWVIFSIIVGFLSILTAGDYLIHGYFENKCIEDQISKIIGNHHSNYFTADSGTTDEERQLNIQKKITKLYDDAKYKCSSARWLDVILSYNIIQPAHAEVDLPNVGGYDQNKVRILVVIAIFCTLAIFFFVSVGALLFSKNASVVAFAMDSVKSLLGFFIGVGMSFMGLH